MLNGVWGIWSCGWDFHKPSQDLVNAFKTKNGLPEFDDYNKSIDYPINGKPTAQKWDPRLFHTVGMPTFPYKYESDYTLTKANSRTPDTYGYYPLATWDSPIDAVSQLNIFSRQDNI